MIDYNAFRAFMSGDSADPLLMEEELRAKRRAREEEVHASIRKGAMGSLKLELFKLVHDYSLRFLAFRDNEREYLDNLTYTQRRCFLELGRRMHERGLVDDADDVWFLGVEENFDLLGGRHGVPLAHAKIAGRKRNFERFLRKEVSLPNYLHPDGTTALPGELIGALSTTEEEGTVLPGAGTAQGSVTGRARVIKSLTEIGSLKKGDVLVCNSTDPGWTPVFLVISGLVLETGGMLSHGACLSREYGLPAVAVPEAMSRIEDGATITVDGDLGLVRLDVEAGAPQGDGDGARPAAERTPRFPAEVEADAPAAPGTPTDVPV
jgi:pyruvate,water dikinase